MNSYELQGNKRGVRKALSSLMKQPKHESKDHGHHGLDKSGEDIQHVAEYIGSDKTGSAVHADRQCLIAEAAYHCAQARGFEPGHELEDWYRAEAEVDARLQGEGRVF